MGVTIRYRGTIKNVADAAVLEKQLMALAKKVGIEARIWWSQSERPPGRVVRGALYRFAPDVEIASFLISPEGWLLPSVAIDDAETGALKQPPWVAVKTQHGPVEAHVAIVELLDVLKSHFFPDLEVRDEGEYWESRRISQLISNMGSWQSEIERIIDGVDRDSSADDDEAGEDDGEDSGYDEDAQIKRLILLAKHARSQIQGPSSTENPY